MRLYQTTGEHEGVTQVIWSGAAADASKNRTAYKGKGYKGVSTEEYDVPTNKVALLGWLNAKLVTV
jgi:hypothetical protein